MSRDTIARLLGAAATGLLLGLYIRLGPSAYPLSFVTFLPWLLVEQRLTAPGRLRVALASGALAVLLMTALGYDWLPDAMAGYSRGSALRAWGIVLVVAPFLLQPQLVAFGLTLALARRRGLGPLAAGATAACAYVGGDRLFPRLFGDTLGAGFLPSPALRQAADLVGARGLTLLLLLVQVAVVATLLRPRRRLVPAALAAAVLVGWIGYGLIREPQELARIRSAPSVTVGVVQANITKYEKMAATQGTFEAVRSILEKHFALSRHLIESSHLDVMLWPETVYPTTFGQPRTPEAATFDEAIAGMIKTTGVPLVFGSFEREGDHEFNAAFFAARDAKGKVGYDTYRKTQLFPFTEHVPEWLDSEWLRKALPWTGRWTPGPGPQVVKLVLTGGTTLRALPLICYEVLDAGYVADAAQKGADLIVTLSNDAWFPDDRAPSLHLTVAAMRSIETRLPQVRATNSGISAVILPTGELRAVTPFASEATFAEALPVPSPEWTLAVAWGEWVGPTAATAALLVFLLTSLPKRAPSPQPSSRGRARRAAGRRS